MIKVLLKGARWALGIITLMVTTILAQDKNILPEGIGTLEAFYAARGDTGYVTYLKRVKRQIQLDKTMGKFDYPQNAMFVQTLIDLYIYSLSPASVDDSSKQILFSTAEKLLSNCKQNPSKQCIELMKAIVQAYTVDNQLFKAFLINDNLKEFITSEGVQDTFTYLLTIYNMAKLGVLMYNNQIIDLAQQEIEEILPYITSPKFYPLVGFIYNAIGVGKTIITTIPAIQQKIKTLKKAEQFLLQSELNNPTKKIIAIIYGNVADAYLELADSAIVRNDTISTIAYWDSARLYIERSLTLANETNNLLTAFYDKFRLAILRLQQGDTVGAYSKMLKLISEAKALGLSKTFFVPTLSEYLIYAANGTQTYDTAVNLCIDVIKYYDSLEVEIVNVASSFFQESIKMQNRKAESLQSVQKYSRKCNIISIAIGIIVFLTFAAWAWIIYRKSVRHSVS